MYPKLRKKLGDRITYAQARAEHVIVEFSFDIVEVARGKYVPDSYHSFIGFQVAKPLLERAFRDTYGLEMSNVFVDEDLAISTYRRAVSEIVPELTRAAWRDKHDEIARLVPDVSEDAAARRITRTEARRPDRRAPLAAPANSRRRARSRAARSPPPRAIRRPYR